MSGKVFSVRAAEPSERFPIASLRQYAVGEELDRPVKYLLFDELIRLLAITAPVRELQIADVRRVSALGYRDNVVDAGGQRVRIFEREINGSAAYAAHGLRGVYPLFVCAELLLMSAAAVGSFDRQGVHTFRGQNFGEGCKKTPRPKAECLVAKLQEVRKQMARRTRSCPRSHRTGLAPRYFL